MSVYAGRPVFPEYFPDPTGNPQELVSVTVYNRGTTVKPTLYTSRTKATTTPNPTTTDTLGNLALYLDPGEYDVLVNGATIPFSVLPEAADIADPASVTAEAAARTAADALLVPLTQRAAANGVATLDGATKVPVGQIPDLSGTYVPTATYTAGLAGKVATDTLVVNVEDHGVAVGNTAAANATALQAAYNLLTSGGVLYFPNIYPVAPDVVTLGKKNVTFRGSGMWSGGIQPGVGGSLFAGAASVSVLGANITFEDMFFGGNSNGQPYILNATGSQLNNLTVRRCRFFENSGITVQGASDVTVEDCVFHTAGDPRRGSALGTSNESRRVIFRGNRLYHMQSGVSGNSGSNPTGNQQVAEHMDISDNYFDGGWPHSKSLMGNSGATVTYAAAVLTDTAPPTPFTTLIPAGQEQTYTTRILSPRRTGTGAGVTYGYGSNNLTDTGANFVTAGVKRGEIVRTSTLFGIVVNVESATVLNVEEWRLISDHSAQPQPAAGTTYTVYSVKLGLITARTATTVTINGGSGNFFDLDGVRSTPANNTLYEIIPHGNYNMHVEYSHRKIKCVGNTCLRSWNDQISLYGYDGLIMGNYVEDGQDFGITIHGSGWVVVGNRIHHQGTVGITVPNDSIIANNRIWETTWTSDGDSYLAGIHIEGSRNLIQGNLIDGTVNVGGASTYHRYGLVTQPFTGVCDSNRIEGNIFRGHQAADIRLYNPSGGTVSNLKITNNEYLSSLVGAGAVALLATAPATIGGSVLQNKVKGVSPSTTGKIWSVYEEDGTPDGLQVMNYSSGQFNCYGYAGFNSPVYVGSTLTVTGQLQHAGSTSAVNNATPVARKAAIASPAATVADLKTAVDLLRVALADFGITL